MRLFIVLILFYSNLSAFDDLDLDGVDDSIDKCPNTPILEIVDSNGCAKEKLLFNINLEIGYNFSTEYSSNKSLYLEVSKDALSLSILYNTEKYLDINSRYIELKGGYSFLFNNLAITPQVGVVFNDDNKDYMLEVNFENSSLMALYQYNIIGNKLYSNYHYFKVAYKKDFSNTMLSSIALEYSTKVDNTLGSYLGLNVDFKHTISDSSYITVSYAKSFKSNYDDSIYFGIGVNF